MMGPLLFTYRAYGGPTSFLGWPQTGVIQAPRHGHKVRLQGGYLYSKHGLGAHVMFGALLHRWVAKEGGPAGRLGYPIGNVHPIKVGQRVSFQRGRMTWVRSSNTFRVRMGK
jgi:uncharacterized protein with LGFP repeats